MNAATKAVLLLPVLLAGCRDDSPAARMHALAPRAGRTIEARLTQFAWSPMRVQRAAGAAAPLDPARLDLAAAAGAVIEKTPGSRDARVHLVRVLRFPFGDDQNGPRLVGAWNL